MKIQAFFFFKKNQQLSIYKSEFTEAKEWGVTVVAETDKSAPDLCSYFYSIPLMYPQE